MNVDAATYMKKIRKHVGGNGMVKRMKGKNVVSGQRTAYKQKVVEIMCHQKTFGCSSMGHYVACVSVDTNTLGQGRLQERGL